MNICAIILALNCAHTQVDQPIKPRQDSFAFDISFTYTPDKDITPYEEVLEMVKRKMSEKYPDKDFYSGPYVDPDFTEPGNSYVPFPKSTDINPESLDLALTSDRLNRDIKITGSEPETIDGFVIVECNEEDLL